VRAARSGLVVHAMSSGYASRLSEYRNKGVVGLPESCDSKRAMTLKLRKLAELVRASSHLVILTGAGISTSANIPDFRGPKGIWTLEKKQRQESSRKEQQTEPRKKKQKLSESSSPTVESSSPEVAMDFSAARPTLTHRAITFLAKEGKMKYCISQNVDGLHRRSGLSRDFHSAVHGCVFTEKCIICKTEYFGDDDVGGMSFQPTGRKCEFEKCGGNLHDSLLDWEDPLPEDDFDRAEQEVDRADLILCLGTSLRIQPVGSLPLRAKQFVIVNLQVTPIDTDAAMVIRAPVDKVMDDLLRIGSPSLYLL
jgi:mono-ADP-ribosyltransferase sirtuin 6